MLTLYLPYGRTLINYANVMGLLEDTGMSKNQFSNLALIFYISYLAFEFPHGYLMQRLPTSKYLGCMVFSWGVVVTVTSACTNFASLVATRVLLGVFDGRCCGLDGRFEDVLPSSRRKMSE